MLSVSNKFASVGFGTCLLCFLKYLIEFYGVNLTIVLASNKLVHFKIVITPKVLSPD